MSSLLAHEDGPFNRIFLQLRQAAGVLYEDEQTIDQETGEEQIETTMTPANWVAEGLICMKCNSIWVGTGLTILYHLSPRHTRLLALPLALSAMSIFQQGFKTFLTCSDQAALGGFSQESVEIWQWEAFSLRTSVLVTKSNCTQSNSTVYRFDDSPIVWLS